MKLHYALLASALLLTACGESRGDRVASGAGIGAVTGGLVGATTGNWETGALIGGGIGAAAGGLTDSQDINLGEPWWR